MDVLRPVRGEPAGVVAALDRWLAAEDEPPPLVVTTSGTTGRPKPVVLSRRALVASARATERRLGGAGAWVLAVPVQYVAGLQVVVRSLLAGRAPVVLAPHGSLAAAVAAAGGDPFVSLVPAQLHRALGDPHDVEALRDCPAVLVGGGPVPAGLRRRAAAAGVRAVATYGATETAGGCVYDGRPLDGVAVAVGSGGRVRVGGPVLFDGYLDDPEGTARVLVDGWFLTSDTGRLGADGRLEVLGRLDDVVVSGGVKVPLAVVAARLREHPGVREAAVVGVADEEWGRRVVAFVEGEISLGAARDWVGAEHPRAWAPREVRVVAALPLLPNGKVDRAVLEGGLSSGLEGGLLSAPEGGLRTELGAGR